MSATLIISVIVIYFLVLVAIAFFTSRKSNNDSFFLGERKSPWYVVSFGMIGASLSGVTFISIPGWVGNEASQFGYMQIVLGYFVGYFIVAYVLIPLYYRLNVTSIYEYLENRFGFWSYKTGATFFLISRLLGASIRLLLVANVLQSVLFDKWNIPFEITVLVSVALIWLYTNRGGIKTIVWTDTLQTAFMLISLVFTFVWLTNSMDFGEKNVVQAISDSSYSKMFFFDSIMESNHFLKSFLAGIFITVGMTGLDQDMMQKNLSCKNPKEAQWNMVSMATVLVFVNLVFLSLGALLYMYVGNHNEIPFDPEKTDLLFSAVAMHESTGLAMGILFLIGLIAAAYSSADSALTSLTTSFSVDFLRLKTKEKQEQEKTRRKVHIVMSAVVILTVIILKNTTSDAAIWLIIKFAGFTYGPLIGLFFFGILTKRQLSDGIIPIISVVSILLTVGIWAYTYGGVGIEEGADGIFGKYTVGAEIIVYNSIITFVGLLIGSYIKNKKIS